MPFPQEVIARWFKACGGHCECLSPGHGHSSRCARIVQWASQGRAGVGCREAHHLVPEAEGGPDTYENCRIFCCTCHDLIHGGR